MAFEQRRISSGNPYKSPLPGEIDPFVVFVANLTPDVDQKGLTAALSVFGKVVDLIVKQSSTSYHGEPSPCYAFAKFAESESVDNAIKAGCILFDSREIALRHRKGRMHQAFPWHQGNHKDGSKYYNGHHQGNNGKGYGYKNDRKGETKGSAIKQFTKANSHRSESPPSEQKWDDSGPLVRAESQTKQENRASSPVDAKAQTEATSSLENSTASNRGTSAKVEPMPQVLTPPAGEIAPLATSSPPLECSAPVQQEDLQSSVASELSDAKLSMVVRFIPKYFDKESFDAQVTNECRVAARRMEIFADGPTLLAIITAETHEEADQIFQKLNAMMVDPNHTLRVAWLSEYLPPGMSSYSQPGPNNPGIFVNYLAENMHILQNNIGPVRNGTYGNNDVGNGLHPLDFGRPNHGPITPNPSYGAKGPRIPFDRRSEPVFAYSSQLAGLSTQSMRPSMYRTASTSTMDRNFSPPPHFPVGEYLHPAAYPNPLGMPMSRISSPPVSQSQAQPFLNAQFGYPPPFQHHQGRWTGPPLNGHSPSSMLPAPLGPPEGTISPSMTTQFGGGAHSGVSPSGYRAPSMPYGRPFIPGAMQQQSFLSSPPQTVPDIVSGASFANSYTAQHLVGAQSADQGNVGNLRSMHQDLYNEALVQDNLENFGAVVNTTSADAAGQSSESSAPQIVPETDHPEDPTLLYVKNLDDDEVANDADLKTIFSRYGEVESAELRTYDNGRSKSFGFVKFKSAEDARKVKDTINTQMIGKKRIFISYAEPKEQREKRLQAIFNGEHSPEIPKADIVQDSPQTVIHIPLGDCGSLSGASDSNNVAEEAEEVGGNRNAPLDDNPDITVNISDKGSVKDLNVCSNISNLNSEENLFKEKCSELANKERNDSQRNENDAVLSLKASSGMAAEHETAIQNVNCHRNAFNHSHDPYMLPLGIEHHGYKIQLATLHIKSPFVSEGNRHLSEGSTPQFCRENGLQIEQLHSDHMNNGRYWNENCVFTPNHHPIHIAGGPNFPINHTSYPNRGRNNYYHRNFFSRGNTNGAPFRPSRFMKDSQSQQGGLNGQQAPHTFHDNFVGRRGFSGYNRGAHSKRYYHDNHNNNNNNHSHHHHNNNNSRNDHHNFGRKDYHHITKNAEDIGYNNNSPSNRTILAETYIAPQSNTAKNSNNKKKRGGTAARDFGGNFLHQTQNIKKENSAQVW